MGTFEEEQRGGIFSGVVGQIHPLTVLNELRRLVLVSTAVEQWEKALRTSSVPGKAGIV